MRDCEEIAQVAHDKSAIVSKSLRLLMTKEWLLRLLMVKEQMSISLLFFEQITQSLFYSNKQAIYKKNFLIKSYFFILKKHEQFAHSLFFKEWCEWTAQVTHDNRETVSKWLRSLTKNERMSQSLVFSEQIAHLLIIC